MAPGEATARRRSGGIAALAVTGVLVGALAVACAGCTPVARTAGPASGADLIRAEDEAAAEAFASLVAEQNIRASKLGNFESRAAIALRRRVGGEEKLDQCDGDVFLSTEGRGAVRLSKVSQSLAWIGGDGSRAWIFDLEATPPTATVFERIDDPAWSKAGLLPGTEGLGVLAPGSVRQLAGFAAIPEGFEVVRSDDGWDSAPGLAWGRHEARYPANATLSIAVAFGPDRQPARVRVLDEAGVERVRATLGEYVRARAENMAIGAWPSVPRRIEVAPADGSARFTVDLDEPSAQPKRMKPRLFRLEEMIAMLRPEQVEYRLPPESPRPGSGAGDPEDGS